MNIVVTLLDDPHPKLLQKILGRTLLSYIVEYLRMDPEDILWIAVRDYISDRLLHLPNIPHVRLLPFSFDPPGHAETLLSVCQRMNCQEKERKTLFIYGDSIYFSLILSSFRSSHDNILFHCQRPVDEENNMYIEIDRTTVVDLVSRRGWNTMCPVVGFSSANQVLHFAELTTHQRYGCHLPYSLERLVMVMIENGLTFRAIFVPDLCWNTSQRQFDAFFEAVHQGRIHFPEKLRICFDLDWMLVTQQAGDYSSCVPIQANVELVRLLHQAGHCIIIHTSRNINGRGQQEVRNTGFVTFQQLADFRIPYDELCFGKPCADFYVDSSAVSSLFECFPSACPVPEQWIKRGLPIDLAGELYFYRHYPSCMQHRFPLLIHADERQECMTLVVASIAGASFEQLLKNSCVTENRLIQMLQALQEIHSCSYPQPTSCQIYANYLPVLYRTYHSFRALYDAQDRQIYSILYNALADYEKQNRGLYADVIHGNPIMSNIYLDRQQNQIKFVGMKSELGADLSLHGDVTYDLGKVYSSLLVCCHPNETLIDTFWMFAHDAYPSVQARDVSLVAAFCLFISFSRQTAHWDLLYNLITNSENVAGVASLPC